MTLRLRLVLALVGLVAVGLAVFGLATYGLYARSQFDRLDYQLRTALPFIEGSLYSDAGLGGGGGGNGGGNRPGGVDRPGPPPAVPGGTYSELRAPDGRVLGTLPFLDSTSQPALAADLTPPATGASLFTTGSAVGSGEWRVAVSGSGSGRDDGNVVVVATPTGEITSSLDRLVLIEALTAVGILTVLAAGAWLVLRRGLRPLEEMATSARSITAGAPSERVSPADDRTEVGQLGLALNTMLDGIEEAFEERDATEQRLRQFLADASHELRTPLTSIQGFAELFRLGADPDHVDLPIIMRRIEEESARMKVLVDDLMLLAQIDQTRPAARVPVDLAVLAADACSDAVAVDPGRSVTLTADGPAVVAGDPGHLRQAIANLVTNALRHTPAGTPIEVRAATEPGVVTVVVRDHGPGLSEDALHHAFDRFWQADPARVGTSAGLGLAIVDGIAQEHGGTATAANGLDGGAVFTLRFPS